MSDKAGKEYWDSSWSIEKNFEIVNPHKLELNNYTNRCFHRYFCQVFHGMEASKMKLLEIGCARSSWLPYFAQEFGFKIFGLDYSEIGCQQTMEILSTVGVKGEVVCADLFSPPKSLIEAFDIVVSFGVLEHFEDTEKCVKEFAKFLKPNGLLITVIPNMVGLIGLTQKMINRPVFDIHVPLDSAALAKSHKSANLNVINCSYFMSTNWGICNLNGILTGSLEWWLKKLILFLLLRLSMVVWLYEDKLGGLKENQLTSPYINCLACKNK